MQAVTGPDYFFLCLDRSARAAGLPPLRCAMAVRLAGQLEPAELRAAVERSGSARWLGTFRWGRAFPFAKPLWRPAAPVALPTTVTPLTAPGDLAKQLGWADRVTANPGQPFRCGLELFAGAGTTVLFDWHHALMDGRGALELLRHVSEGGAPEPDTSGAVPWTEGMTAARALGESMRSLGRPPLLALNPVRESAPGGRLAFRCTELTASQTADVVRATDAAGCGFCPSVFILAAALRATDELRQRRGIAPGACLAHVPHDLRRKGAVAGAPGNRLSFFSYRAESERLGSVADTAAHLREQLVSQVRSKAPQRFAAAMEASVRLPLGLVERVTREPAPTVCVSDLGDCSAMLPSFLGREVVALQPLPPVPYPPGLQLATMRFGGLLSWTLAWAEARFTGDEADLFERVFRRELCAG